MSRTPTWQSGPFTSGTRGGFNLVHPDGSIWILDGMSNSKSLSRFAGGRTERIARGRALGLDDMFGEKGSYSSTVDWEAFWFDRKAKTPCVALKGQWSLKQDGKSLRVFRWTGKRFEAISVQGKLANAYFDHCAVDLERNVLVHFAPVEGGGMQVGELRGEAWWQGPRIPLPEENGFWRNANCPMLAGWDARHGVVVLTGNAQCFGWDGKAVKSLPAFPAKPRAQYPTLDNESAEHSTVLPSEKRILVRPDRHYGNWWVLADKGWKDLGESLFPKCAVPTYDPKADRIWFLGTRLADGQPTPTAATFDGKRFERVGPVVVESYNLVLGEAGTLVGDVLFRGAEASLVPAQMSFAIPGGFASVYRDVTLLRDGKLKKVKGPPALQKRSSEIGVAHFPDRDLIVWCFFKERDTWAFDGKKIERLRTRGRPPGGGLMAYHPGLHALVMAGGKIGKSQDQLAETGVFDGTTWQLFPSRIAGDVKKSWPRLLAFDPATGQLFLYLDNGDLHVWAGGGDWKRVGALPDPFGQSRDQHWVNIALQYDPAARRILAMSNHFEDALSKMIDIGPLLDAAPKPKLAAASPAPPSAVAATGKAAKPARPFKVAKVEPHEGEGMPPRRALIFREGTSDKFWIGELDGKRFTARWGRRGTPGQSKPQSFPTPDAARKAYEKKVNEKLDEGYVDAPEDKQLHDIPGRNAWTIQVGKRGEDQVGGVPPGFDEASWPRCKSCKDPLTFVAFFARHPERMPLARSAAVALFYCNYDSVAALDRPCPSWDAGRGANAVRFLSAADVKKKPLASPPNGKKGVHLVARGGCRYVERLEHDPSERLDDDEEIDAGPHGVKSGNKLGGYPYDGGDAGQFTCGTCGKAMRLAAQMSSEITPEPLNFGDVGTGYLWVCPDDHEGKFRTLGG